MGETETSGPGGPKLESWLRHSLTVNLVKGHDSSEPQFVYLCNGNDGLRTSQVALTPSWKQRLLNAVLNLYTWEQNPNSLTIPLTGAQSSESLNGLMVSSVDGVCHPLLPSDVPCPRHGPEPAGGDDHVIGRICLPVGPISRK